MSFDKADLEKRDGLVPLLFRAEITSHPDRLLAVVDALRVELARNPAFARLQRAFTDLLAKSMGPWPEGIEMPDDLLELRNMFEARFEDWKQQKLQEGEQAGRLAGRQEGRQAGEATLLTRLLEQCFGPLPAWARDRIIAANTDTLEEWGLRVLDGTSLDDILVDVS